MNKKIFLFLILGIALGFVILSQLRVGSRLAFYSSPQSTNVLAREVLTMAESNQILEQSLRDLDSQDKNYALNLGDKTKLEEEVKAEIAELKIINGKEKVSGEGVKITMDGKFTAADLVDLFNAIKNIGFEAAKINDIRLTGNQGFRVDGKNVFIGVRETSAPLAIEVIGDSDVLKSSLERIGGIFEQLKNSPDLKISAQALDKATISPIE